MSYKTKLLTGIGVLWIVGFAYRYLILYLDKSQAIWGIALGVGILFVAWTVNRFEEIEKRFDSIKDTIANIDDRMEELMKHED